MPAISMPFRPPPSELVALLEASQQAGRIVEHARLDPARLGREREWHQRAVELLSLVGLRAENSPPKAWPNMPMPPKP